MRFRANLSRICTNNPGPPKSKWIRTLASMQWITYNFVLQVEVNINESNREIMQKECEFLLYGFGSLHTDRAFISRRRISSMHSTKSPNLFITRSQTLGRVFQARSHNCLRERSSQWRTGWASRPSSLYTIVNLQVLQCLYLVPSYVHYPTEKNFYRGPSDNVLLATECRLKTEGECKF